MINLININDKVGILNTNNEGGYLSIYSTMNEYITWAFALQFFYDYAPDQYHKLKKQIIRTMHKRKFVKFSEFIEFHEQYMNNRSKYKKLKDLYP